MTTTTERPARTSGSLRIVPEPSGSVLQRPLASYYLVLVSTGLLLAVGLVMVFSASSVRAYATFGSSYALAAKQALFMGIGLIAMGAASRVPVRVWRMIGYPLLAASVLLLIIVLIPGIGKGVDGARRWIPLPGGFNLQPSEMAKLALALWGADLLVRKRKLLGEWKHLFVPLVPVATVICGLIMLEPDMGTTMTTVAVVVALLWVVGTPLRYFGVFVVVLFGLSAVLAVAEPYRMARLTSFLDPFDQALEGGYQAVHGLYALSAGGWFGLGLGASREKWAGGLPAAYTDYIFAIIGEELGLLGTFSVLMLFATFVYAGVRVAKRSADPFVRLAAAGVTAWLAAQAVINMGAVTALLPITGIPLPLVSFGGSAMVVNLLAIGMLLAFARAEPGAPEALAARRAQGGSQLVARLLGRPVRRPAPSRVAARAARGPAGRRTGVPAPRRSGARPGAGRR